MPSNDQLAVSSPDCGATAIEYSLMASLIAVAVIVGATLLGQNVVALFNLMPAGL